MNPTETPNRCRLVLIAPPRTEAKRLLAALDGGDVASLILPAW
ncbi:MAG: thiamine phosphate synthase, partial [Bauldia sp.]